MECPHNCYGNGECVSGTCNCFPGFLGPYCSRGVCGVLMIQFSLSGWISQKICEEPVHTIYIYIYMYHVLNLWACVWKTRNNCLKRMTFSTVLQSWQSNDNILNMFCEILPSVVHLYPPSFHFFPSFSGVSCAVQRQWPVQRRALSVLQRMERDWMRRAQWSVCGRPVCGSWPVCYRLLHM